MEYLDTSLAVAKERKEEKPKYQAKRRRNETKNEKGRREKEGRTLWIERE